MRGHQYSSLHQQQSEADQEIDTVTSEAASVSTPDERHSADESEDASPGNMKQSQSSFSLHFGVDNETLSTKMANLTKQGSPSPVKKLSDCIQKTSKLSEDIDGHPPEMKGINVKRRLMTVAKSLEKKLNESKKDMSKAMFAYQDVAFGARNLHNQSGLRDVTALHVLDHIFQTRDQVIKNNSKLAQVEDGTLEVRDQGFTRPKVLVLVPTREACVKWVDAFVRFSQPEQQENKSRFTENFHAQDDEAWQDKPADFRDLFAGNIDDNFRVGIKFTRKTIKFFSSFYNSDIIFASSLGLTQAINGTSKQDKTTQSDSDFLSSIEIAILDNATAIQMQNWRHVEHIFARLNLLPNDSHGCDFSRVRTWYLDGNAKHLRQTIILSDFLTPEINSLISQNTHNVAGLVKYVPSYRGAILDLPPSILPGTLTQTFMRFHSPSPATDADTRFTHFATTILPTILRSKHSSSSTAPKGTLIYISDYAAFLRLRNHLNSQTSISFTAVSEYTSAPDLARSRSHFLSGRHALMLMTERLQHFRRLTIKGVRRVLFYGLPENPIFWGEVLGWIGMNDEYERRNGKDTRGVKETKGRVRALFSKWDVMKLERIVGTERVGRLVGGQGRDGDIFEFT